MTRTVAHAGRAALLALAALVVLVPLAGRAQVPTTIGYQGALTDAAGTPVNATLTMVFSLYDAPAAASPLWRETQTVTVSNGIFSLRLGSVTPFPADLFTGPRYLGVQVGTDAEMTPRLPFDTVPFAFAAERIVCPSGQTKCGGNCVDLQGDAGNCGACGVVCVAGEACFGGLCVVDADSDGWPAAQGDCDDGDAAVNPGAAEVCADGIDNDCNGYVDEVCPPCDSSDPDGDGVSQCAGDCNPSDATVKPGAAELCDGKDNDCNLTTVANCAYSEPCNWPGGADVCGSELVCACTLDETGSCTGAFTCQGFCNTSQTGAVGDGSPAGAVCLLDLDRSANVHGTAVAGATPGTLLGGEACTADQDCRSLSCGRLALGPGTYNTCLDWCGSDAYCQADGTVCRLERLLEDIDGRCWPESFPGLGAGTVGDACTVDTDCDRGFCSQARGTCTAACTRDSDCPGGFTCSLQGDQISTGGVYVPPGAPSCVSDAECDSGLCVTSQGACGYRLTETSPMCLADVSGQGSSPAGAACAQNADCRSNLCDRRRSVCVDVCGSDGQCPTGLSCRLQVVETVPGQSGEVQVTNARVCVSVRTDQVIRRK